MRVDAAEKGENDRNCCRVVTQKHLQRRSTADALMIGTAVITDVVTEIVAGVILVMEQSLWLDRVGAELLARRMEIIDY